MTCESRRKYYDSYIASIRGSHSSKKKSKAARENGKLGGRPKKK